MALIEYSTVNEAKAGFSSLSFKNFKGRPLLLEKAPVGVFTKPVTKKENVIESVLDNEDVETCTLYAKNLNFDTTSEKLKQTFGGLEGFRSAKVSMKKDLKHPGKMLSLGFGFIEFDSQQAAKSALKAMQVFWNIILGSFN